MYMTMYMSKDLTAIILAYVSHPRTSGQLKWYNFPLHTLTTTLTGRLGGREHDWPKVIQYVLRLSEDLTPALPIPMQTH